MAETIGIVGLGIMGSAYAKNLSAKGFDIVGYDVDEGRYGALGNTAVTRAQSPADVAAKADRVLTALPNAKALRLIESGSFLALQHKWTLRTCFNAQEEIYLASMDEIAQVQAVHPQLGRFLGPPCVLRNRIVSPRCTEGTHFCGVPVWLSYPKAERRL